jgi:hypothetical protein
MKQQKAIQYLAFDLHQATIAAICRDADGNVVPRATVATDTRATLWLVRRAGPRVHVASEEGKMRSGCTICSCLTSRRISRTATATPLRAALFASSNRA